MDSLQDVFEGATTVEENAIHYSVFLPLLSDSKAMLDRVQESLAMIRSLIQPYTNNYLWQKDQFHLVMVHNESKDPSYPYIHGITRFGDCIHDEWFIVFLLRLITEKIPDSVVTLEDNDGDVLLIEAAMTLPAWLDPSNSQNRVALYQGQVHIIPMPRTPADLIQVPATNLSKQRAIDIIRNPHIQTLAETTIQEAIDARKVTQDERHYAKCTLPAKAAYVLLQQPQLLPLAVEAFYLRDPIGLKACSKMNQFQPNDSVTTSISFTKTTYAQTVSQKFYPPKPFRLPLPSNKRSFAMAELGMKVACGLEMLYHQQSDSSDNDNSQSVSNIDDDPKYKQFLGRLTRLGYFRQERPGSKLYRLLEEQAQEQYREMRCDIDDPETFSGSQLFSDPRKIMDDLLSSYSDQALENLLKENPDIQDSDEWMNVDPEQLEELLNQRMGQVQNNMMADIEREINNNQDDNNTDDDDDGEPNVDLDKMMSQFEKFIEGSKSGLDGVNFPGEEDEENDDFDSDNDYEDDDEDMDAALSFDTKRFMNILTSVLGPDAPPLAENKQKEQEEEEEEDVIKQMDEEINAQEKITGSFARENDDVDAPVDVNLNLVKNILESYKSQQGLPGPAGNILGQFGIVLPADEEEEEGDEATIDDKNVNIKK